MPHSHSQWYIQRNTESGKIRVLVLYDSDQQKGIISKFPNVINNSDFLQGLKTLGDTTLLPQLQAIDQQIATTYDEISAFQNSINTLQQSKYSYIM